jgi:putative two-component system response regulator
MSFEINPREATILVVDDTPENLSLLNALLKERYRVKIATGGRKALAMAADAPPDLILLDVMMPEMDGYETCRRFKQDPVLAAIPIIFLSALGEVEDEKQGFAVGAVDYITKPLSPSILMARLATHLALKKANDVLKGHSLMLEAAVTERTAELERTREITILAMASLAETRDNETGNHLHRTASYVKILAEHLMRHSAQGGELDDERIALLTRSAPLHDIGKVGIPDAILLKPGKLTFEEFEIMKGHSAIGRDAIAKAEAQLGVSANFLSVAKEIAGGHHEKWNGTGYPDGLAGTAIPLSARLMALADVYDALISKRVYKDSFPRDKAEGIILEGNGTHFDPEIVKAFMHLKDEFWEIAETLRD